MHDRQKHGVIKTVASATSEVFCHGRYAALAVGISAVTFLLTVWLPNIVLITEVMRDAQIPVAAKIKIPLLLLDAIRTNFSVLSASYTVAAAILFGANFAMIAYLFAKRKTALGKTGMAAGLGGMASGVLGIGCAACGSFAFGSILSAAGASGALMLLPLRGAEFGIVSVMLLALSVFFVSREIAAPLLCKK